MSDEATRKIAARLIDLLEAAAARGVTQQQIAAASRLPSQYLSDLKYGRRPLTELAARRLADGLGVSYLWLLGVDESESAADLRGGRSSVLFLPVLSHPTEGEPRLSKAFQGRMIEISGPGAVEASRARLPYVLEFNNPDVLGRLRRKDLVLVCQSRRDDAEIQVVKHRSKLYLARCAEDGYWKRVANGSELPPDSPSVGHVVAVMWGRL